MQGSSQAWNLAAPFSVFSVGELHAASKTSSANESHLNVWGFDISAAEFPQQKKRVFSAAEIMQRKYQNPIHLNGTRIGRGFGGSVKFADGTTSSANVPHLNVWDVDISAAEFPQQKKTRVFGVNRPLWAIQTKDARFFLLRKFCCGYIKTHTFKWGRWRTRFCTQQKIRLRKKR